MSVSPELVPVGTAKKYAKRLHRFLTQQPIQPGLAWSQEAAARMLGYPDWHALHTSQRSPVAAPALPGMPMDTPLFSTQDFPDDITRARHWIARWFEAGMVRVKLRMHHQRITLARTLPSGAVVESHETVPPALLQSTLHALINDHAHDLVHDTTAYAQGMFGPWTYQSMPLNGDGFEMTMWRGAAQLPTMTERDFDRMASPAICQMLRSNWQASALGLWVSSARGDDAARVSAALAAYLAHHGGPGFSGVQLTDPLRWSAQGLVNVPVLRLRLEDYSRKSPNQDAIMAVASQEPHLVLFPHAARDKYSMPAYLYAIEQGIATIGTVTAPTMLAAVWRVRALMSPETLGQPGMVHAFLHHERVRDPATQAWVDTVTLVRMDAKLRRAVLTDDIEMAEHAEIWR